MSSYRLGLVDTNILVFAVDRKAPERLSARRFLRGLRKSGRMILTPQVFLEFYNVVRGMEIEIVRVIRVIHTYEVMGGMEMVYPLSTTYKRALRLARRYRLGGRSVIHDAFLAATAIDNGIKVVYTQNVRDFEKFRGVQAVDPLLDKE